MKRICGLITYAALISTVLFLGASNADAARVKGCANESKTNSVSCTLNGVAAGDEVVVGATSLHAGSGALSFSDNCGGKYTVLDTSNASNVAVAQGYGTGSSGTCTVTAQTAAGWATKIVAEEITPATLDAHGWNQNQSITAGTALAVTANTTAADYVFSWAVDEGGNGGSHMTVSSPFWVHDFNNIFPIADADMTQPSAGSVTATWTFNVTTSHGTAGMIAFKRSGGSPRQQAFVRSSLIANSSSSASSTPIPTPTLTNASTAALAVLKSTPHGSFWICPRVCRRSGNNCGYRFATQFNESSRNVVEREHRFR